MVEIEVVPVNDAPEILAPEQITVRENTPLVLLDITLSDIDNDLLILTLSVTNGSLVPSESVEGGVTIVEAGENGNKSIQLEGTVGDIEAILPELTYLPAPEVSEEDSLNISLSDAPSNESGSFITQATVDIQIGINQPPQVSDIALEVNSGQVVNFTEGTFSDAYTDPDSSPEEDGLTAIIVTSLPENGQLIYNGEVVTEEQITEEGLLISREDIPNLSYQILSNEVEADSFTWSATDGDKAAEENANVSIAIKLLSLSLATENDEICLGESTTLTVTAEGGTAPLSYQWSCDQANCGISDNSESILVNPDQMATYQVVVTDANGIQVQAAVPVNVVDCNVVIPTGFTPNGDNINDTWELQNINTFEERLVEVYNRYGHRVFFSDTYSSAWDGTYNGDVLPPGTYYYRIELDAGSQSYQGQVTILK